MESKAPQRSCVVLVPAPFQGHITPMLQLGNILHSKGFSIIVAHSEFNSPNPSNRPDEFLYLSLPDNTSGLDKSFMNLLTILTTINISCKAPLQEYLVQLMEKEEIHGRIACIIYDSVMYFIDAVANDVKLPTIVMRPNNAAYVLAQYALVRLIAEKKLPLAESQLQEIVPNLSPFRFKDLPFSLTFEIPEIVAEFWERKISIGSSRAVIWNTMGDLECPLLSQLQQRYQVPFFCIGPFHKSALASRTSLLEEDNSCMAWLDKQAPNSVLYISFGSIVSMDKKELVETTRALAKSEQLFLWVIRADSDNGSLEVQQFPEDFEKIIGEKGRIVKWAPQKEVLAHPAVGGFWSHCGWNSTLESISEGTPMICRPLSSDQRVNARYVTHVWKIGLELDCTLERGVVEETVRRLMVDLEGEEMRRRALGMKRKLKNCVQKGGPAYQAINDLSEFISSLSLNK